MSSHVRRALALIAALSLAVVAGAQPAASSPTGSRRTLSASCLDLVARLVVPAERVAGDLPDGFNLLQVQGETTIQLVAAHCAVDFNGESTGMDYAALIVDLESPEGSYDLWELTDSPHWHSVSTQAGKYTPLVEGVTFDLQTDPVTGEPMFAHQDVPWIPSQYTMEGTVVPRSAGPPPDMHFKSHHWWSGPRGATHRADDNSGFSVYGAVVTIDPAPGSELARILGSDAAVTVPGVMLPFQADFTWCGPGTIEEVSQCPPAT